MANILLLEDDTSLNRGISLKLEKEGAGFEQLEQMTLGALRKAVVDGDTVHGSLMAGQIAGLVNKEQSCKEIIEDIMRQGKALLGERN